MKKNRTNQIEAQLKQFHEGIPKYVLCSAAKLGSGIKELSETEERLFKKEYEKSDRSVEKFVPASGAATRMFKDLQSFRNSGESNDSSNEFLNNLDRFPFDLKGEKETLLELFDEMKIDQFPKGLLPFHLYSEGRRTPVEEHLVEGINYASKNGVVSIHFTVSPEHLEKFIKQIDEGSTKYPTRFDISFSIQSSDTDTVAVDLNNEPILTEDGEMLFRPAGHGALLENLNQRNADLIFIKNIDNVLPDRLKEETTKFKKVLAGVLLHFQQLSFDLLQRSNEGEDVAKEGKELLLELGLNGDLSDHEVIKKLNRPIRICGMVKNQGEPGGGPFWVKGNDGLESLQIVESAQVDRTDPEQGAIFIESTHFNPVDLVCGVKDFKGNKFDLRDFSDPKTGFITEKSYNGKTIKAMELPGLWNGSMANWNTIFVEVPLSTFSPVKTINDLLKSEHQC